MTRFQIKLGADWKDFDAEDSKALVEAFGAGHQEATDFGARLTMRGQCYEFDFKAMTQKNSDTGRTREIRPPGAGYAQGGSNEVPIANSVNHEWIPIRRGDALPAGAVLAGDTYADGKCYVARGKGSELGKLNLQDGKMWNIWAHQSGAADEGEILCVREGAPFRWKKVARDDQIPEDALLGATTDLDGPLYPCRAVGGGAAGKMNVDDDKRKCYNFWFHGDWLPRSEGEVLLIGRMGSHLDWHLEGGIYSKLHRNKFAGVLAEGDFNSEFITYEIALPAAMISHHFGDHVQCNYDDEHKKIFADGPEGIAIRASISAEHECLYRDGIRPDWLRPEGPRTECRQLVTGRDFFDLIGHGIRSDKGRVYTYACVDDSWNFSETGAATSKDVMSKHAVHANAEPKIRYSGTFRVCFENGSKESPILVLDNDSGTYRPCTEDGLRMKSLLESCFSKLKVRALTVLEGQPEETKSWTGPMEIKTNLDMVYPGTWTWKPLESN